MYIISKYDDYYDGAVSYGIDKSIVYERSASEYETPDDFKDAVKQYKSRWNWGHTFTAGNEVVIVGFCGKLYVGIEFTIKKKIKNDYDEFVKVDAKEILYDVDKIKKRLRPSWNKKEKYYWGADRNKNREVEFDNYLTMINSIDPSKWFRDFHTPVFVYGSYGIDQYARWHETLDKKNDFIVNPILRDYQFAKVIDPYTAFQEVQMYISGVLGISKDGTEFPATEKEKVAQHGMDKWTFRRPPSK